MLMKLVAIVLFPIGRRVFRYFWAQKGRRPASKMNQGDYALPFLLRFLYVHEAIGGILFRMKLMRETNSLVVNLYPLNGLRKLFLSRRKLETMNGNLERVT